MSRSVPVTWRVAVLGFAAVFLSSPMVEAQMYANFELDGSSISSACNDGHPEVGGVDVADYGPAFQAGASGTRATGHVGVGALQLRPYKLVKAFDACSPLLFNALALGQSVRLTVKIFGIDPFGGGQVQLHQTVTLDNALIVGIASASSIAANGAASSQEIVSLTFQRMTIDDHVGNTTAQITWPNP